MNILFEWIFSQALHTMSRIQSLRISKSVKWWGISNINKILWFIFYAQKRYCMVHY